MAMPPSASAEAGAPDRLKIVLVEDERDVREGLALLIHGTPGFQCTGRYRTMEEALPRLDFDRPDVLLTDIGLPGMSGIEGIALVRKTHPDLPVLALTVFDTDDKVMRALCAGASGYVLKNTLPARLLESLQEAARGGAPMSPEIARRVVRLFRAYRPAPGAAYHFTPQETELLKLLADGHHKKTAAHAMGISVHTVSFHLKHIYEKLQVHSKTEAVAKALRERLV
jgi:DNA-binding NarL/FixJ family response regulator